MHGECGGYMVLGTGLVDAARHAARNDGIARARNQLSPSGGCISAIGSPSLVAPIPGHATGARLRGHEFHYASILAQPDAPLAAVRDANGAAVAETGSHRGRVTGTFFHMIAEAA